MRKVKFLLMLAILFAGITKTSAQSVAINTDGSTANASAILDAKSTAKGILIPRMNSIQRSAIVLPANGLLVYDTDSLSFAYYNGTAWSFLKGTLNTSAAWTLKGNAGTNASSNFIGTSDAVELKFRVNNFASGEINHNTENTFLGFKSGLGSGAGLNNTAYGSNTFQTNTGSFNTAIGYYAMNTASASLSQDNTAIGHRSMFLATGGIKNVGVGSRTLTQNTTGSNNVAVGVFAMENNLTGTSNVAVGLNALFSNTNRNNLVAIGDSALFNNGTGGPTATQAIFNTAVGSKSLATNSTGYENTAIGYLSARNNTIGYRNTTIGFKALFSNTTGRSNVAVGAESLWGNTSGELNLAVGNWALTGNTSGDQNVALGQSSMALNNSGNSNVAVGVNAGYSNSNGYSNVAIGHSSLYNNINKNNLVAVGDSALFNNSTGASVSFEGTENVAVGSKALYSNTTGYDNTAIGFEAMKMNTTGALNSSLGYFALYNNVSGGGNVAMGINALANNVSGDGNVGVGYFALGNNTISTDNVALGNQALSNHYKNNGNVGIGKFSFWQDTTGLYNVGVGYHSGYNNRSGNYNIALGYNAMYNSKSGSNNIAIGNDAGSTNTTGNNNIAIGNSADFNIGTLTNAIAIGNLALSSSNNSMVLGSINGVNGAVADTKVGIGVTAPSEKLEIGNGRLRFKGKLTSGSAHGITWTSDNGLFDRAFLGMESDDLLGIYNYGFGGGWNIRVHNTSGEMGINKQPGTTPGESRLQIKQTGSTGALRAIGIETALNTNRWDIWVDNNAGPDFNFNYNGSIRGYIQNATGNYIVSSDRRLKKDIQPAAPALDNLLQMPVYTFKYNSNTNTDPVSIGFMAQDVQKFYPNATPAKADEKGEERLGLNYQAITALSVKAIQEQQQIIQNQTKQIENLQTQIDELKKLIMKD